MKRVSVTIPDELAREVRRQLPGVNVSGLLQDALRGALEGRCAHRRLECAVCAEPLDARRVAAVLLDAFYRDLLDALEALLFDGGSIEGAARIAKKIGLHHQIPLASMRPLPRLTRGEREAAKDRHPSHQPEETAGARTAAMARSAVA